MRIKNRFKDWIPAFAGMTLLVVCPAFADVAIDIASVNPGRLGEEVVKAVYPAQPGVLPAHVRITFDENKLFEQVNFRQPQVLVIPIEDYRKMFDKKGRNALNARIKFLNQLIERNAAEFAKEIPVFPVPVSEQKLHAQPRTLRFSEGMGIRFITRYSNDNSPATNDTIFYAFSGTTNDGKYIVTFFHPIKASNLPVTEDGSFAAMYMDQIAPDSFDPSLDRLDALVQSITFKRPSPK